VAGRRYELLPVGFIAKHDKAPLIVGSNSMIQCSHASGHGTCSNVFWKGVTSRTVTHARDGKNFPMKMLAVVIEENFG
jgi:hypothetical protein